jgi:hypothetical protein
MTMRYIILVAVLIFANDVSAYAPLFVHNDTPFQEIVIPMDSEGQKRSYLGTLDTYPHLYEFALEEPARLEIQTKQRRHAEAEPVNLILLSVHPDTERISEIVRLNTPIDERNSNFIGALGITVYESEWLELELDPGLYRLEVSTPSNEDAYELDFGVASVENGYFGTMATIWQVQRHFDYWWTRYLLSTFVAYQVGIVVLVGGLLYTWRKRKIISNVA